MQKYNFFKYHPNFSNKNEQSPPEANPKLGGITINGGFWDLHFSKIW